MTFRKMLNHLKLSSPGKLILCGEHSVVYGKKALATAISLRTHLNATRHSSDVSSFLINLIDINRSIKLDGELFHSMKREFESKCDESEIARLDNAMDHILKQRNDKEQPDKQLEAVKLLIISTGKLEWTHLAGIELNLSTQIPLSSGLGSSASFAVCLSAFFLLASKNIHNLDDSNLDRINRYSFYIEKLFHGKPSGIDNSLSTFGNYVLFEKGCIVDKFQSNLNLPILLVNSCVPKQTLEQVLKVRRLHEKHTQLFDHLMESVDLIVQKYVQLLKLDLLDNTGLEELININQGILYSFHVSNFELNTIVNLANKYQFSSKITGSGGGGCCYILLFDNGQSSQGSQEYEHKITQLTDELNAHKFQSFKTKLGCRGLSIDEISFN